jgi:acetoin utilization protein AcuC
MAAGSATPPLFLGSDTFRRAAFNSNHPLNSIRHSAVVDLIRIMGWLPDHQYRDIPVAGFDQLLRFHDRSYLRALQYADSEGRVDSDIRQRYQIGTFENPLFAGLFERAATTVGGSILAAELAMQGHLTFHPSGGTHHGRVDRACGFCYFNDPVFAILTFLDAGLERILYVDLDAHHGDGVEEAFFGDDRVHTLSLHETHRWPYSGTASYPEAAAWNLPVPPGFNDTELDYLMQHAVLPMARALAPEALVVCCGADCLNGDPLSRMLLSNVALWRAVRQLIELDLPSVIVGGGGYNPWTVSRYWAGLWATIAGYEIPATLPDEARALLADMSSDLVDEDDVDPRWLAAMSDTPYPGVLRSEVVSLAEQLSAWTGDDGKNYGLA